MAKKTDNKITVEGWISRSNRTGYEFFQHEPFLVIDRSGDMLFRSKSTMFYMPLKDVPGVTLEEGEAVPVKVKMKFVAGKAKKIKPEYDRSR